MLCVPRLSLLLMGWCDPGNASLAWDISSVDIWVVEGLFVCVLVSFIVSLCVCLFVC